MINTLVLGPFRVDIPVRAKPCSLLNLLYFTIYNSKYGRTFLKKLNSIHVENLPICVTLLDMGKPFSKYINMSSIYM